MKKILLSASLILAAIFSTQHAQAQTKENCLPAPPNLIEEGKLTVGISLASPPTAYLENDQASGLDPDLIRALTAKMCIEPKFVNMAFSGLFPALIAKRLDVIHSQVGITDVRKETFDFVPVFVGGVRIVASKDSGLQFTSEQDTCGSTMAIMGGSTQMAALERVQTTCPADKQMVLKPFGGQAEALNEVGRGTAQAAFVDWSVATYAAKQRPDQYVVASPILSGKGPNTERNRIGIVFRKGNTEDAAAVKAAFDAIVADGQYDALLKKYGLGEGDIRAAN
ncbi:transporter substrate-binding domain-containing protein [Brucella pseudogrignonensis]|uniref:transporter substrate-binding domain-containing protein n=1 Tax=Brucella pseudogrignonensis TaxID=419475 RepID=UPI0028B275BB|nr:transporter substrate-binding domain-containing protein [Brucella pseudogrignonensis]MDT6942545.1 transporter substrate-binding domain-containing protein [Brucella pseudogrignonensis]